MSQLKPFLGFILDRNVQKQQFIQHTRQQVTQPCRDGLLIARDHQAVDQSLGERPIERDGITGLSEHVPIEQLMGQVIQVMAQGLM
jgi:hypothetical protein